MENWYALVTDAQGAEQRLGPLAFAELVHLVEAGRLGPDGLVWRPGMPAWVAAATVAELTPEKPAAPRSAWPSDALPLWIVAGIVACFLLHFSQRRFTQAAAPAAKSDAESRSDDGPAPLVELEICNRTAEAKLYTTVAYYDTFRRDWVARGWYPVDQGGCSLPLKNLKPPVFVYAETKEGRRHFGDDEEGVPFCISPAGPFVFSQKGCDGRRVVFRELKADGATGRLTWELGE